MKLSIESVYDTSLSASFEGSAIEESKIFLELQEQKLQYIPTSMNNDRIPTRVIEKISLNFSLSDDIDQNKNFIKNYKNLKSIIKPIYIEKDSQYVPVVENFLGLIKISFDGFVNFHNSKISKRELIIHLTNFSYSYNRDGGFTVEEGYVIPKNNSFKIEGISIQDYKVTTKAG